MALTRAELESLVHNWFRHLGETLFLRQGVHVENPHLHFLDDPVSRDQRQLRAITGNDHGVDLMSHRAPPAALRILLTPSNWPDTIHLEAVLERLEFLHRFHEAKLVTPGRLSPVENEDDVYAVNDFAVAKAFAGLVQQEGLSHAEADTEVLTDYLQSAFPVALALWSAAFRIYRHIRNIPPSVQPGTHVRWSVWLEHVEGRLGRQGLLSNDWLASKDYIGGTHHSAGPRHAEPVFGRIKRMDLHERVSLQPYATLTDFLKLVPQHLLDTTHEAVA
ncbi:uncharacterized protein JCM10292_001277 [Rhodotorula paludigena]|uniref:uncharacterized protein n=1 Tax=Rhodotorula paludigena TaxID=86838 RepID=UPI0031796DD7